MPVPVLGTPLWARGVQLLVTFHGAESPVKENAANKSELSSDDSSEESEGWWGERK